MIADLRKEFTAFSFEKNGREILVFDKAKQGFDHWRNVAKIIVTAKETKIQKYTGAWYKPLEFQTTNDVIKSLREIELWRKAEEKRKTTGLLETP